MGVMTLPWNEENAIKGLKSWVDFVLANLYDPKQIRRGRRNAPASSQRQVTILPLDTVSRSEVFTVMRSRVAQRNLVEVGILLAGAGNYSIKVLGSTATYLAGGGDNLEAIRDGLSLAVVALALPVAVADVGTSAFTVQGDVAGVWLGLSVSAEPVDDSVSLVVTDDVAREATSDPGRWPVRITIDDVIASSAGARSGVCAASNLVIQVLKAYTVPIVNGNALVYAGDLLKDEGLDFLQVSGTASFDYSTGVAGAPVWHQRSAIDVVFNTSTGIAYDLPTIESEGPISVTINDP